jgi:DnaJ-class molecular chaperone
MPGKHEKPRTQTCPGCDGAGKNKYGDRCGVCHGSGKI